ncbi:MAG: hypothetical protein CVU97_07210 [Firmicutes bacterium HGW-Firmicutes-21]|nr:MAG: hypothetical protein CVU97_07210 [Firmicutes bacterium HGW-Firmicutes-21]
MKTTSKKALTLLLTLCFVFTSICMLTLAASAVSPDDDNVIPVGNINAYWIPLELADQGLVVGNVANIYTTAGATLKSLCGGDYLSWWHLGVFVWSPEDKAYKLTELVTAVNESTKEDKGAMVVPENGFIIATNGGMNSFNSAHALLKAQEIGVKAYLFGDAAKSLNTFAPQSNLKGKLYISLGIDPNPDDDTSDEESSEVSADESSQAETSSQASTSSEAATSSQSVSNDTSSSTTQTGDKGITTIIIIAIITLAGIAAIVVIKKRR